MSGEQRFCTQKAKGLNFLYIKRAQPMIISKYCKCTNTYTQPMRNANLCSSVADPNPESGIWCLFLLNKLK